MPQLDWATYPSQLFWLCLSFFVLWVGLQFWGLRALEKIMAQRRAHVEGLIAEARSLQTEAEDLHHRSDHVLAEMRKTCAQDLEREATRLGLVLRQEKEALSKAYAQRFQEMRRPIEKFQQESSEEIQQKGEFLAQLLIERLEHAYQPPHERSAP